MTLNIMGLSIALKELSHSAYYVVILSVIIRSVIIRSVIILSVVALTTPKHKLSEKFFIGLAEDLGRTKNRQIESLSNEFDEKYTITNMLHLSIYTSMNSFNPL